MNNYFSLFSTTAADTNILFETSSNSSYYNNYKSDGLDEKNDILKKTSYEIATIFMYDPQNLDIATE